MKTLYEMLKGIDDAPFNGIRDIDPTPVVVKNIPESRFNDYSLVGNSREAWYNTLKQKGLTLGKTYTATKVEGYGDVFDVFVTTDSGKEESFMELTFDEPKEKQ